MERPWRILSDAPHSSCQPGDNMLKTIGSKNVKFLYCAPHTFYFGDDMTTLNTMYNFDYPLFLIRSAVVIALGFSAIAAFHGVTL